MSRSRYGYVDGAQIAALIYTIVFALMAVATIVFAIIGIWGESDKAGNTALVTGTVSFMLLPGFFLWAVDAL